jgi:hypothetical protein
MMDLIKYCRDHTIEQILELPDVQERVALYREHAARPGSSWSAAPLHGQPGGAGPAPGKTIWATNRFMIYALFPQTNISIHVMWGLQSKTPCLPRASPSSTAAARPMWAT